ncbi:MAG: hypothetical protein OSA39_01090 [Sphingobium sp.]|nr:hypothetical protein [Sphingobium sp.]
MHDADGDRSIPATPPPARRRSILPLATLVLLAFVIGVALTVWAWPKIQQRWNGQSTRPVAAMPQAGTPSPAIAPNAMSASSAQMLDARVAALDERLTRITVEAQAASGNAARAEGLLIAFAARRALDNGGSLGYIEAQLRSRFGQAQPRAVATIINAAREPVTLADLRVGLTDLGDQLTTPPVESDWWDAIAHEARELVTIRKASAPSPRPQAALERAVRYLDGGRVSAALAEIERMPGRAAADRWLQFARRYLEARRALDLIETAAILEPRPLRSIDPATASPVLPTS